MRLKLFGIELQHDRNYGIDKRTGWSICVAGSFYCQLEPWLIVATCKAIRVAWLISRDASR